MADKSLKVNCSFCGKEIECPENMMKAEKHSCFDCFQNGKIRGKGKTHIDFPKADFDEYFLGEEIKESG